ncbi:MAG: hypothetical protein Q9168_002346 [Polycauliona sp. 1 TL-2023]
MSTGVVDLTIPSSSPTESNSSVLYVAIDEAQPNRLRDTLRQLCSSSKDIALAAEAILLVPLDKSQHTTTSDANGNDRQDGLGSDSRSKDGSKDEASTAKATWGSVHGLKRVRSRYAMCENCEKEFDVTLNESGDCIYHPGTSIMFRQSCGRTGEATALTRCIGDTEVDEDATIWNDHNEDVGGEIDSEEKRSEYPEGFIYDCCDKRGDSEGCQRNRHIENTQYAIKRSRY